MNDLQSILENNVPIPETYRNNKTLEEIKIDLEELDFTIVTNPHLFNLRSLIQSHFGPSTKRVKVIQDNGFVDTGDLEIDNENHSYWANGIPVHNTINLPYEYPLEEFKQVYLNAYNTGYIKGVTTYRAGTMASVLSVKEEKNAEASDEEIILQDVKLPASSPAIVKKIKSEGKKWYITVILNEEQNRPFALFVQTNAVEKNVTTVGAVDKLIELARTKGIPERHVLDVEEKMAGEANAIKIARVISLLLRHGVLIKNIVRILETLDVPIGSFIFQIKKFLSQYIKDGEKVVGMVCESCGSHNVVYSEGCFKCSDCGNSKCG